MANEFHHHNGITERRKSLPFCCCYVNNICVSLAFIRQSISSSLKKKFMCDYKQDRKEEEERESAFAFS